MYDGVSSVISAVDLIANGIRISMYIRNVEVSLSFRVDYCVDESTKVQNPRRNSYAVNSRQQLWSNAHT